MTRRRYGSRATTRNDSLAVAVTRRVGCGRDSRHVAFESNGACVRSETLSRRPSQIRCVVAMIGLGRGKTRLIVLLIPPKKHVGLSSKGWVQLLPPARTAKAELEHPLAPIMICQGSP